MMTHRVRALPLASSPSLPTDLVAAAEAFGRAIDLVAALDVDYDLVAGSGDREAVLRFERERADPAEQLLRKTEAALVAALESAGLGGIVVAGRVYLAWGACPLKDAWGCPQQLSVGELARIAGL